MDTCHSSGGAAAASGFDFQCRVVAWVAVHILSESGASAPWDLPAGTTLEWLQCETTQPVDDLLVGTSSGGFVFAQIKRTVHLSSGANSHLSSAIDQFVRQFVANRTGSAGAQPSGRPLDPARDRFILIVSSESSGRVRHDLCSVLNRARALSQCRPLDEAATSQGEREALSVIRDNICRSWQTLQGTQPSEDDIRQLLTLIYIHVLDVHSGGEGEREAQSLLRTVVLRSPGGAAQAWAKVVELCAQYAAHQSGADRGTLQRKLLDAGFDLRAVRGYEEDIERLREYSHRTSDMLAHLARIQMGSANVKIGRPCVGVLEQAAEAGSLLIVGEPGVGKSGVLHDFAEVLHTAGKDYVFLAADKISAESLRSLRQEIGLEHDLLSVFDNWPGLQPGYLIIDALDAARKESTAQVVRDLMRQVIERSGRWRVIASVRKFDLRYSEELKQLFRGNPPFDGFTDLEFGRVCHFNIPHLSEDELEQVSQQSPELGDAVQKVPGELRILLRIPFNLRLVADLVSDGITPEELAPVKTQLELLDKYWYYRVVRDRWGDAREAILRQVCEQMVAERRLHAERPIATDSDTSFLLNNLLSDQVLVEWQASPEARPQRDTVAFSHHVLFDYAVARLLFRDDRAKVVHRLSSNPDLVMVIRPSLVLHFRHLWDVAPDRQIFWDLVFEVIRAPEIPEIGKLIGPSVAAELAQTMLDLQPLCSALQCADPNEQNVGEQAFRHLVGSLLSDASAGQPLAGINAGPWCELLDRVSQDLRASTAYTVRLLLAALCEHVEQLTPEQLNAAGKTARRLLEFAWSQSRRDGWFVGDAIQCVCRTFESDPSASDLLIRCCIETTHLAQFGYEEMHWVARNIRYLVGGSPGLARDIYRAAFAHREVSEEPTPMGTSRILCLRSNRRQDYEMALYMLAEAFPEFLCTNPEEATRALVSVVESYVSQEHSRYSGRWREEAFKFGTRQARLCADYSHIWDQHGIYCGDYPVKMLDDFQRFLEELSAKTGGRNKLRKLIDIVVSENRVAVVWRRLLLVGAHYPDTLGREILPLASAFPILTGIDTTVLAGEYLRAIFPILDTAARQKIERAVLSIPFNAAPGDRRQDAEEDCNRLLGCLSVDHLVTDEARQRLQRLNASNSVPSNEPPTHFEMWSAPYGEEEHLRDLGVPVDDEANRRIRELEQPVKEFTDRYYNKVPSLQESRSVLPALRALHRALNRAEADGVHPKQQDVAWGLLAQACAYIAKAEGLSPEQSLGAFVRRVLLEASVHPDPIPNPEYDAHFDETPSWGGQTARIEAAAGLITLARHKGFAAQDVCEAIERLSRDPVPSVRYQIACRIHVLCRTQRELMWRIIDHLARIEESRGVLQGFLAGPLSLLARAEPDRVLAFVRTIMGRITAGPGANKVREFGVGLLSDFHIGQEHPLAKEVVERIITDPVSHSAEAHYVLRNLREPITYGPIAPSDPQADAIRKRAVALLESLLRSVKNALRGLLKQYTDIAFDEWSPEDQTTYLSLARLLDDAAMQVYFASGADEAKEQRRRNQDSLSGVTDQAKRFYREAGLVLDLLTEALTESALPSVAHYLLQTLEYFVPLDPRGVFLRVHQVVAAAQQGGYQYETMAVDLIVQLVHRYLAEYRHVFQQHDNCRKALIEVLDVFVKAGWPSARRLVYHLEEIFR